MLTTAMNEITKSKSASIPIHRCLNSVVSIKEKRMKTELMYIYYKILELEISFHSIISVLDFFIKSGIVTTLIRPGFYHPHRVSRTQSQQPS